MKKAKLNVEITELFMAQADRDRRFHGTIKREEGLVRGDIKINDGHIYAVAPNQDELGKNLDEMVKLILDVGIHDMMAVTSEFNETKLFLN